MEFMGHPGGHVGEGLARVVVLGALCQALCPVWSLLEILSLLVMLILSVSNK